MKFETPHIVITILLLICIGLLIQANFLTPKAASAKPGETASEKSSDKKGEETTMDNENQLNPTLKTIFNRKSVRKYTDKKVTKEQLEMLVKAGMAAPTAGNKQPWAFVIVTDREKLDSLAEGLEYAKMLKQAPSAIVVCGVPKLGLEGIGVEYWIQDCSAVSENILLAVESMGLGAVWTGVYPIKEREKYVQKVLGIPEDTIPLNVIAIGYPTGIEKPKDKYKPERIHYEKW